VLFIDDHLRQEPDVGLASGYFSTSTSDGLARAREYAFTYSSASLSRDGQIRHRHGSDSNYPQREGSISALARVRCGKQLACEHDSR